MKLEIENQIARYLEDKIRTIIAEKGENASYNAGEMLWCDLVGVTNRDFEKFKRDIINVVRKAIEDNNTFYVMCDGGKRPPRYPHQSYASASKEAKRLTNTISDAGMARILLEYDSEAVLPF